MDELTGTNSDFPQTDTYSGDLGDGSTSSPDILDQILNSKAAQAAAAAGVTAIVGGQKVVQNSNGTYQKLPANQQGGAAGAQGQVISPLRKVPGWAWIAGIFALILGGGALVLAKD